MKPYSFCRTDRLWENAPGLNEAGYRMRNGLDCRRGR